MGITQTQTMPKDPPAAMGSQIGHNRPPLDEQAKEEFEATYAELLRKAGITDQRRLDLIGAADRAEITSEETLAKGAEAIRQIRAVAKIIDETHAVAKAPYLAAGRAVDAEKNDRLGPLSAAKSKIEAKQSVYVTKRENDRRKRVAEENARLAKIEQERQERAQKAEQERLEAIEAGKPAPPPPPPEPEPAPVSAPVSAGIVGKGLIRGAEGATVSASLKKVPVVTDYVAAFAAVQSNEKVREAVDKAIGALVRAGLTDIPGVEIREEAKVNNR